MGIESEWRDLILRLRYAGGVSAVCEELLDYDENISFFGTRAQPLYVLERVGDAVSPDEYHI